LIIKRGQQQQPLRDFKIFYLGCNLEGNDTSNQEFLGFSRLMKNTCIRRKNSKKLNDNGLNFLNAIRQFKSADEMKRKMVNLGSTPIKGM
jgi:hypothetical protein